jgi:hypothetical protein
VTTTVEGRERYGVILRYPRDFRDDPQAIASQVLVPTMGGAMVPLGQVAQIAVTLGPPSIRTENAQPVAYIYVDLQGRDLGGYVADAARAVAEQVKLPPGYHIEWSGQFEYLQRAAARLRVVVPATLLVILVLLYLNFGRLTETLIVMLSVPFALVGGAWLMWWLGYNLSVAVAVGFIALAGVAAETGVVMLIYLDHALNDRRARCRQENRPFTGDDLRAAIIAGAVERVRPKMMTVAAIMAGLLPILWSTGTGSEVMRRIAVPMVGGMLSSTVLTLIVIPAIYAVVKRGVVQSAAVPPLHTLKRAAEKNSQENDHASFLHWSRRRRTPWAGSICARRRSSLPRSPAAACPRLGCDRVSHAGQAKRMSGAATATTQPAAKSFTCKRRSARRSRTATRGMKRRSGSALLQCAMRWPPHTALIVVKPCSADT